MGVGRRTSRVRRCRLALERREVIFAGWGGGLEFSSERMDLRDDTGLDMAGGERDVDRWKQCVSKFGCYVMSKQIIDQCQSCFVQDHSFPKG